MYKLIFLVPFLVLGHACAPRVAKVEKGVVDTLLITEVPAEVETVYVTETKVETVKVAEAAAPYVGVRRGAFKVQIGAFKIQDNATRLYNSLKGEFGDLIYIENIPPYWKVRLGAYDNVSDAVVMRDKMRGRGYGDAWIVRTK